MNNIFNPAIIRLRQAGQLVTSSFFSEKISSVAYYPYNKCPLKAKTSVGSVLTVSFADPRVSRTSFDASFFPAGNSLTQDTAHSTNNGNPIDTDQIHNFHLAQKCFECSIGDSGCAQCLLSPEGLAAFKGKLLCLATLQAQLPPLER